MNAPRLEWPANLPRLLWSPRTCPLCKSFEFTEAELQPMDRPLALFFIASASLRQLLAKILRLF